ncbi:FecR domain-containing protein [Methylobacillus arboreus]|uniref:FecR family protein n=1 Tax=Methylobacillus arboreus TaxID=755170 RepID=UPI001E40FB34|nr:FecR domain-containing protein [Methylobacillus arboreus]MCB5191206.1 FecR domain-containing protein [Methylobacillus arboreus]
MWNYGNSPWRALWQPVCILGFALAANHPAQADTLNHTVEPGDNLHNLAAHYLGDPNAWPDIQKLNRIANPHRLKPGSTLVIPRISSTVTASFVHGEVMLLDNTGQSIKAIAYGEQLAEGSTVRTGNNSYLSLEFADKTVARILANTSIRLDRIKEGSLMPQGQRVIYLEQGDVDVSATPAPKRKQQHFKVITPQAVAAVRGTRFMVGTGEASTTSSVTQGQVEMQQGQAAKRKAGTTLQAGQGIAATANGLGQVQTLLPAPNLSQLPASLAEQELLQFSWPALTDSSEYQYRIARDESMEQVIWNEASTSANATLPGLDDGDYRLAVRALDAHGIAGYESQHQFSIRSHPSSPWLLAPQAGQATGSSTELLCTPVEGAHGYHLQIASDNKFEQIIADADQLESCQYQPASLAQGEYYWRVATIAPDTAGNLQQGPYSLPSPLVISEDAGISRANPGQAYWISGQQNIRYLAQISRNPQFEPVEAEQLLDSPTIDIQSFPAGRYYIRLATQLENGTGPFSDARIIEIEQQDDGFDRTWFDKPKS